MDNVTRGEATKRAQGADASVLDTMAVIGDLAEALRSLVSDGDPSRGVERMMHCSLFGELILSFPDPRSIRIPLVASDDKSSLAGRLHTSSSLILLQA